MQFVWDAPDRKTSFQIETEAEAALESALMCHAVEKHFRQTRDEAARTNAPPTGSYIEQDIGLKAHIQRDMPVFLTLRDGEGTGLRRRIHPAFVPGTTPRTQPGVEAAPFARWIGALSKGKRFSLPMPLPNGMGDFGVPVRVRTPEP